MSAHDSHRKEDEGKNPAQTAIDGACPTCEKCGAPIESGLIALLCPGRQECAMWPSDGAGDFESMFPDTWSADEKQRFREHCEARVGVQP
jgi:hypothetical protein